MKKFMMMITIVLSIAMIAGCGKSVEENAVDGADASGDVIVINETSKATDEMNGENAAAQEALPEQESASEQSQEQQTEQETSQSDSANQTTENVAEGQNTAENTQQEATETAPEVQEDNNLQIVFLGDSILDGYRDETGIAYLTGQYCGAEVYNLAIGGTRAALTTYEKGEYDQWESKSLQGVVHVLCGNVDSSLLDGTAAGEAYAQCDLSNTDYFVIEYGMNDFLSGIRLNDEEDYYDEYTYVGALRIAVKNLREAFPSAEIVLCSPTYGHFWAEEGFYLGDGNMADCGGGALVEYYRVCGNVSADMNTLFFNAYEGMGLDAYTADEYLEDGIHLSQAGRQKYAQKLSEIIMEHEQTKNN